MNSFKITVNNQNTFEINEKEVLGVDVVQLNEQEYHLLKDHQSFPIQIIEKSLTKEIIRSKSIIQNIK